MGNVEKPSYTAQLLQPIEDKSNWIWRYMDLAKFVNLIGRRAIYVPQAQQFSDKREGLAKYPADDKVEKVLRAYFAKKNGSTITRTANDHQLSLRKFYHVSCWNNSDVESVALWNLYTRNEMGICIRTDIPTVSAEFKKTGMIIREKQLVYEKLDSTKSGLEAFFRKTPEYSFESEYRFIIDLAEDPYWDLKDEKFEKMPEYIRESVANKGLSIPLGLTDVIKEIRVHYQSPPWFVEDIKKMVEVYGLNPELVRKSDLHDES